MKHAHISTHTHTHTHTQIHTKTRVGAHTHTFTQAFMKALDHMHAYLHFNLLLCRFQNAKKLTAKPA